MDDIFPVLDGITIKAPGWVVAFTETLMGEKHPNEVCALVFGRTKKEGNALILTINSIKTVQNVINSPSAFEISPVEQFKLMNEERASGNILLGILHTHPGSEFVSASDAEHIKNASKISNLCWFIAGKSEGQLEIGVYMFFNGRIHAVDLSFF